MQKKLKILLISLFVLLCSGCNADATRDIRHAGFSLSGVEFECSMLLPSDSGYDKTRFLDTNFAITTDGTVYQLSLSQVYSNEMNCKKANFSHKIDAVFDNRIGRSEEGKFYYLVTNGENAAFTEVTNSDSSYELYKLILGDKSIIKVITIDQNAGHYYVLKDDGNVYDYLVSKNNGLFSLTSFSIVYNKSNYNSEIIDFNYAGKSPSTFIRTSDEIFKMTALNSDECLKYADVKCQYEMLKSELLTEHIDKILGYNGSFLITTYGKEFNVIS